MAFARPVVQVRPVEFIMTHVFRKLAAWSVLAKCFLSCPASGGEFRDRDGMSFTYPADWIAVADPGKTDDDSVRPPQIDMFLEKNWAKVNKLNAILFRKERGEFVVCMNVAISPGETAANRGSLAVAIESLERQAPEIGTKLENVSGRLQKYGANDTIVVEYQNDLPGTAFPLRQRTVFFAGGGKTYMVTCMTRADAFDAHADEFDAVLTSVKVPASVPHANHNEAKPLFGFDFWPAFTWCIVALTAYGLYRLTRHVIVKWLNGPDKTPV